MSKGGIQMRVNIPGRAAPDVSSKRYHTTACKREREREISYRLGVDSRWISTPALL